MEQIRLFEISAPSISKAEREIISALKQSRLYDSTLMYRGVVVDDKGLETILQYGTDRKSEEVNNLALGNAEALTSDLDDDYLDIEGLVNSEEVEDLKEHYEIMRHF
jgi:hypothetical protein